MFGNVGKSFLGWESGPFPQDFFKSIGPSTYNIQQTEIEQLETDLAHYPESALTGHFPGENRISGQKREKGQNE